MKLCVINPNSDEQMTRLIRKNAEAYAAGEFAVECLTNTGAPPFIGSYQDTHLCEAGLVRIVKEKQESCDAFIIACHSDPGLDLLKEISGKPVVGICEASVKLATMLGHSFSVISSGQKPVPNKEALCRRYGVESSLASVVGPAEIRGDWQEAEGFLQAGRQAVEKDGCEVLVLGCAGMGYITEQLAHELGVPVLDGVTCGLIVAQGLVKAGLGISKKRRYYGGL